jgi:hypothetical protein
MTPTIALFIADPKCSVQSGNGILKALGNDYKFKIFSKNLLEEDFFDNVDMVAVPGGFGDADSFDTLFKHNAPRVKQFVRHGGRYLGICMGAYWAGSHYLNMLNGVDAVQYIRRPGTDTRRPHAKAQQVLWNGEEEHMFFYDGCALVGPKIKTCELWSLYPNGDPMAIIQNKIGLIGCHPESERFWYDSYKWMRKHWHEGRHHELLLEFVNRLMEID